MKSIKTKNRRRGYESLEPRHLLTSIPLGASSQDTAEYLLGDVSVNVVFLESNGNIDADTEQWSPQLADGVKANIEEGLQWWVDLLALHTDVHELNFEVDYTHADQPVEISYEPITRGSQDFALWIEEFFRAVDVPAAGGFTTEIREFNHRQRLAHETNWSFTIFVVNAENDPNDQFGDANGNGTVFRRAFAYPGGQFIVMPHSRPANTVAHEVGHMFWAHDEYVGSDHYTDYRGYYRTQNTNAADGHPNPSLRESSIMASRSVPFANYAISRAARETLGWRDSDGDGIFDVLDVPHQLWGDITYNYDDGTANFTGSSQVRALNNRNPSGTGNDITLNRITGLQYRTDGEAWQDLVVADDYDVSFDVTTPSLPVGTDLLEFRTIDHRIGVTSNIIAMDFSAPQRNSADPLDVNADGFVSPIDVLQVIIAINGGETPPFGSTFLDVSGDSFLTALDALMVINYLNAQQGPAAEPVGPPPPVYGPQLPTLAVAAVFAADGEDEEPLSEWGL